MSTEKGQMNDFGLDDDDDFGDFGGFEVAEPVVPQVAQPEMIGLTATPSPWALFPGVQPAAEPDTSVPPGGQSSMQCDQQELEEDLTDDAEATFTLTKTASTSETTQPTFIADFDQKKKETEVPGTRKKCDDTPADSAELAAVKNPSTEVPQINTLSHQPTEKLSAAPDTIDDCRSPETERDARKSAESEEAAPSGGSRDHIMSQPSKDQKQKLSQLQTTLGTVQAERDILRKKLESVTSNQERWNQDLQICKEQLEQQIKKYDTLQVIHTEALAEMRKAGHDALTVIVDEYKELSRKAVLQQQDLCQQDIKEALTEEATRWQLQLKEQREQHAEDLENLQCQIQEELKNMLETERKEQQSNLEKTLERERQEHKESMTKAVQEERERSGDCLQEALRVERVKMKALLKEEQDKFESLIAEEREKSASAIKEATTAEQLRCEQCMKKALEAERQQGDSRVKEVMEHARKEMKSYVAEQKLADNALRRRQLTSLDLFLECSRKQLDMLLSDPPPGSGDTK